MTCRPPSPAHLPVSSVHDLADRVAELLPVAVRRQLWTLFFDRDDVQLPMMVPLEGIPERPSRSAVLAWGRALEAVVAEFEVAWVSFVIERPGGAEPNDSDRAWCESLSTLDSSPGLVVRSVLGCTDVGVRPWVVAPALPASAASASIAGASSRADQGGLSRDIGGGARRERIQSSPRRLALAEVLPLR
ncbi:hypothetical protein [Frigoribacterium sp. Leaf263]|uniref:hypothetical protein n=1 Tax=Frigoribacterium sp. Leaf263 TaxID=1736313 RepID=UPI000A4FC212|nr:hypothetical protein [Frigoribacterium sp. Leaf263]